VIGDVRRTDGAEQDGVELAELVGAVGRHHHAMLAVIVRTPVEVLKVQGESAIALGAHLQDLHSGLNHLGPDAITAHGGDLARTHVFLLVGADPLGCNSSAKSRAEEPEFSLPRYALLCNGDHVSAWIEIADTKRLIAASCAKVEGGA